MEKIKPFIRYCVETDKGKDILVIIIIILTGLGSFELGRLSKNDLNPGIKIDYGSQEANAIESVNKPTDSSLKKYFASSKGSKYYSLSCSGGKTIKEDNRVYFATSNEAEQAGYELSASCK